MTTSIFLKQVVYWLCVSFVEKVAGGGDHRLAASSLSLSVCLSPCFALSGSNLVVLIIKASAGCCCRVNQEVKRAPKNSIFTQVDQHNKEHAGDRARLLSCQIKWQRGWLLETDNKQTLLICVLLWLSQWARKVRYTLTRVDQLGVSIYQLGILRWYKVMYIFLERTSFFK